MSNTIHNLADDVQAELAHLRQQVDGLMTQSISPTVSALAHRAEDAAHTASHAVNAKADELSATVKAQPLAAIAVAAEIGLPDAPVAAALAGFGGVGRRFQRYGEWPAAQGGTFTLIDDYGHHPVEMRAVLAAARGAFPGRRIVLAFQPHRYTRPRDCFADFVEVIQQADAVLLTEVYAAGESRIEGADAAALLQALHAAGFVQAQLVAEVTDLPQALAEQSRDGDVVIVMGAGSIGAVPAQAVELLKGAQP